LLGAAELPLWKRIHAELDEDQRRAFVIRFEGESLMGKIGQCAARACCHEQAQARAT
jgi:hypothetical protein